MGVIRTVSTVIAAVGAINWLLLAGISFDLVAWIAGGSETIAAKVIYIVIGIFGIVSIISLLLGAATAKE